MTKRSYLWLLGVALGIILMLLATLCFFTLRRDEPKPAVLDETESIVPEIPAIEPETNPVADEIPELNPVEGANPFSSSQYKNPFE